MAIPKTTAPIGAKTTTTTPSATGAAAVRRTVPVSSATGETETTEGDVEETEGDESQTETTIDAAAGDTITPPDATSPTVEGTRPAPLTMNSEQLKARLVEERKRITKQVLADLGIADVSTFKVEKKKADEELKRFRTAEEKRKRDAMSEAERVQADLKGYQEKLAAYEAKIAEYEAREASREQDSVVSGIAANANVADEMLEPAMLLFKRHVVKLAQEEGEEAVNALDEKAIRGWFAGLVKTNPRYARQGNEKRVEKRPADSGGKPPTRPSAPQHPNTKTFKPGQANSMTRAERDAEARKFGITGMR